MPAFPDATCSCGQFRYGGHICDYRAAPPPPEVERLRTRWTTAERAFDRVNADWPQAERALVAGLLRDEQRRIDDRITELESSP